MLYGSRLNKACVGQMPRILCAYLEINSKMGPTSRAEFGFQTNLRNFYFESDLNF